MQFNHAVHQAIFQIPGNYLALIFASIRSAAISMLRMDCPSSSVRAIPNFCSILNTKSTPAIESIPTGAFGIHFVVLGGYLQEGLKASNTDWDTVRKELGIRKFFELTRFAPELEVLQLKTMSIFLVKETREDALEVLKVCREHVRYA